MAVAAVVARQEGGAAETAEAGTWEMAVMAVASSVEAVDSVEHEEAAMRAVARMATGRLVEEPEGDSAVAAAAGRAGAADRVASLAVTPAVELATDWVAHGAAAPAVVREVEHGT